MNTNEKFAAAIKLMTEVLDIGTDCAVCGCDGSCHCSGDCILNRIGEFLAQNKNA